MCNRKMLAHLGDRRRAAGDGFHWVRFGGAAYLTRGSVLTGLADALYSTLAIRLRPVVSGSLQRLVYWGGPTRHVSLTAGGLLDGVIAAVPAPDPDATPAADTLLHIAWRGDVGLSGNLANTLVRAWVNGTEIQNAPWASLMTTGRLQWSQVSSVTVGATNGAGNILAAGTDMAFLYMDASDNPASYVTDPAKFTAAGLGPTGQGPTGAAPLLFMGGQQTAAQWGTNQGTGGNLTLTGSLTDAP